MYSPTGIDIYFSEDEGTPSVTNVSCKRTRNETPSKKQIQQENDLLNAKALNGDVDFVRNTLSRRKQSNTGSGFNVLHAACCGLQLPVIKEILKDNRSLLKCIEPEQKRTPLHCALGAAFDKEELEEDGIVLATSLLPEIVTMLVSKSEQSVFIHQDLFGRTPLHIAVTLADVCVATTVLSATPPSSLFFRNHTGDTSLHIASRNALRDSNFLELLLLKYLPISHLSSAAANTSLPMWNRLFHKKKKSDELPPPTTDLTEMTAAVDEPPKQFSLKDLSGSVTSPTESLVSVAVPATVITPLKSDRKLSTDSSTDSVFDITPLRGVDDSSTPIPSTAVKVATAEDEDINEITKYEISDSEGKKDVWLLRVANHGFEAAIPSDTARELLLKTSHRLVAKLLLESVCCEANQESDPPMTSFVMDLKEEDIEHILDTHGTSWIDVMDKMVSMIDIRYRFAAFQTLFAGALVIGDEITDYLVTILLFVDGEYFWAFLSSVILIVSQMTLVALLTRMGKSVKYRHAFKWVPNRSMRLFPIVFDAKVFWTATKNLWRVTDLTKTKSLQGLTIALAFVEAVTESTPQAILQFFLYREKHKDSKDDTQFYLLVISLSISVISILKAVITYIYFKCFNRTNILGIIKPVGGDPPIQ
eukprot:TRINITY_DN16710_c0_g1_i1.p1 TRINITY_DN16710_c0_g1~~TRINITY_DN16710_c0_g1_i1.p1  ORF type:complete len:673 (+),score=136.08 TRINITY_DN16710_c0_g1_i1:82-2019(+)